MSYHYDKKAIPRALLWLAREFIKDMGELLRLAAR